MTDPNLRRALHVSCSERKRELLAEGVLLRSAERAKMRHWAVMQRQGDDLDQATVQMLGELGVAPLCGYAIGLSCRRFLPSCTSRRRNPNIQFVGPTLHRGTLPSLAETAV